MSNETVRLELKFRGRLGVRPLLDRLAALPNLVLNIVRGRVTSNAARFEIEMTGTARELARAVRLTERGGASVRALPQIASMA